MSALSNGGQYSDNRRAGTGAVVRRVRLAALAVTVAGASLLVPVSASASPRHTECVGTGAGCQPTLRRALAAAHDGDTVLLGAGRYRGGVTIDRSVHLVGAGEARTAIAGGGPVVTVTRRADGSRPTVTLADLALTGGIASGDGVHGFGGGLYIATTPAGRVGDVVTLTRVWVHGNRATATRTSASPSGAKCPRGYCPFALGSGGGIFNAGRLTLIDSRVEGNVVTGRLSDAIGGGIYSEIGSLSLVSSIVAGNHARPKAIGRFAEGGGLFVDSGALRVHASTIADNSAELVTSWPIRGQGVVIEMSANGGGIHIGDGVHATIDSSEVIGNRVSAVDPAGEPAAFDSALLVGNSTITVDRTVFAHNSSFANSATYLDAGFSGTAVEFDGSARVTRSRISDNTATSISRTGPAAVGGGLAVYDFDTHRHQVTVINSSITGNRSSAYSATQDAAGVGGGVINNSFLHLTNVLVSDNSLRAGGKTATVQGGGIWNGPLLSGPPVGLRLSRSLVTRNTLSTEPGGTRQGGGLYTSVPFTRIATAIRGNHPDDVFRAPAASPGATLVCGLDTSRA